MALTGHLGQTCGPTTGCSPVCSRTHVGPFNLLTSIPRPIPGVELRAVQFLPDTISAILSTSQKEEEICSRSELPNSKTRILPKGIPPPPPLPPSLYRVVRQIIGVGKVMPSLSLVHRSNFPHGIPTCYLVVSRSVKEVYFGLRNPYIDEL